MAASLISSTARIYGSTHEPTKAIIEELAEAMKRENWGKINVLLQGVDATLIKQYDQALRRIGSCIPTGDLYTAAEKGSLDLARLFIALDPDILRNPQIDALKPLQQAIHHNNSNLVEFILEHNPQLRQSVDAEGSTLLHHAAKWGSNEAAKVILSKDPICRTIFDKQHRTPLMTAMSHGHVETVRLLASGESIEGLKRANNFSSSIIEDFVSRISHCQGTDPLAARRLEHGLKQSKKASLIIATTLNFKPFVCGLTAARARERSAPPSPLNRFVNHPLYEPRLLEIIKKLLL